MRGRFDAPSSVLAAMTLLAGCTTGQNLNATQQVDGADIGLPMARDAKADVPAARPDSGTSAEVGNPSAPDADELPPGHDASANDGVAVGAPDAAAATLDWPTDVTGPGLQPGHPAIPAPYTRPVVFLLSLDPRTRRGTYREVDSAAVKEFVLLPHAEILVNGRAGFLDEFRPLERVTLRLHDDDAGRHRLATYIKSDLNHLHSHDRYYRVDSVSPDGRVAFSPVKLDGTGPGPGWRADTFVVDDETKFWKDGRAATRADLTVGALVRIRAHGTPSGPTTIAWDVVLDDVSLESLFRAPQGKAWDERTRREGLWAYVSSVDGQTLGLRVLRDWKDQLRGVPGGKPVRVAPSGWDGAPLGTPAGATLSAAAKLGSLTADVALLLEAPARDFTVGRTARLWIW